MKLTYRYRLDPPKDQAQLIDQHLGCARVVYNRMLDLDRTLYQTTGKSPTVNAMITTLPTLKEELPYLKEVNAAVLQQSVRHFGIARDRFFRKISRFPHYKTRRSTQAIRFPLNGRVNVQQRYVHVDTIGNIRAIIDRPIPAGWVITAITITKNRVGQYHASVLLEDGRPMPCSSPEGKALGLDLGLKDVIVDSEGNHVENPKYLQKSLQQLKREQRHYARCKAGSHNKEKSRLRLAKYHLKIANQRKDFIHKLARRLVDENQVLVFEALRILNMIQNHHLAQAISSVGWGMLLNFCRYKAQRVGKLVLRSDPRMPSSQLCSHCGYRNKMLKLKDRVWTCPQCNTVHDRDHNAAKNVVCGGLLPQRPIYWLMDKGYLSRA